MIWLGVKRGYLTDWVTQRWVQVTGRRVEFDSNPWLSGPIAPTTGIGPDYFDCLADQEGLRLSQPDCPTGVVSKFSTLRGGSFDPGTVHPSIIRFYEETTAYELDAWAEWCGVFRPFGWLLAVLFSRRLQQLNVPLSGLDTVHDSSGVVWARYVRSVRESIHVFPGWDDCLRGDHVLTYFGATFLRLHYRMRLKRESVSVPSSPSF